MAEHYTPQAPQFLLRALSALLAYPQQELLDVLPALQAELAAREPEAATALAPLFAHLQSASLVTLQMHYVACFDRNPRHALHLFEHVHGESRDRGPAMVDLLDEYRRHGFEPAGGELPDYLPLFLELLGQIAPQSACALLDEAIAVIAAIGARLAQAGEPHAALFALLQRLASVEAAPLQLAPVREMDETLERFGPDAEGREPLLGTRESATQPLQFHPRTLGAAGAARA